MARAPRIIFWELTKKCDLKCSHCRIFMRKNDDELTTKEIQSILDNIKKEFSSSLLILSGGEPLLRTDLFEILSYVQLLGLKAALATNGMLINEEKVLKLKRMRVERTSISLDSTEEKKHDKSRGVNGSFKKALESFVLLRKHRLPFQINFTVTKTNIDEIYSVASMALSVGAQAVHYFILINTGCARRVDKNQTMEAKDICEVLIKIKSVSQEFPIELKPTCAPQYVRFSKEDIHSGCLAGDSVFFISSEGNIYPCGYLPVKAGSIKEKSIADIWKNSPVLKELRQNKLKGRCLKCSYKNICRGCRARSYALTGDYMEEDPSCQIEYISD